MIISQTVWLAMGLVTPLIGADIINSSDWQLGWLYRSYVARARYTFFIANNLTIFENRPELEQITAFDSFLVFLQAVIVLAHELQTRLIITAFALVCATLWLATRNFEVVNKPSGNRNEVESRSTLVDTFNELKELADSVNSVWNFFCFWFLLDITVWLATDLDKALRTDDWLVKIHVYCFMVYTGIALTLSAETYRKVGYF